MSENAKTDKRVIVSNQFGRVEAEEEYVFVFEDGLLGFEDLKEFILIYDEETAPFRWLVSVDNPEIVFPTLNPFLIDPNYSPDKNFDPEKEAVLAVVTLNDENNLMTANLKAPIILNPSERKGRQIILHSEKYTTRQIIAPKKS